MAETLTNLRLISIISGSMLKRIKIGFANIISNNEENTPRNSNIQIIPETVLWAPTLSSFAKSIDSFRFKPSVSPRSRKSNCPANIPGISQIPYSVNPIFLIKIGINRNPSINVKTDIIICTNPLANVNLKIFLIGD